MDLMKKRKELDQLKMKSKRMLLSSRYQEKLYWARETKNQMLKNQTLMIMRDLKKDFNRRERLSLIPQ